MASGESLTFFAQNVNRIFGIKTVVPDVLESLRLR